MKYATLRLSKENDSTDYTTYQNPGHFTISTTDLILILFSKI